MNSFKEVINYELNSDLKKILEVEKTKLVASRSSKLQPETVKIILEKIQTKFNVDSSGKATAILTVLFQQGGTARSCDGNMNINIFGENIKLADIRKILKEASCNKAERKLARSLATEIHEIGLILEIPGNLYNKIQKEDFKKMFSMEERVWLSDFQSDNENCPQELRTLILNTFKKKELSKITKGNKKKNKTLNLHQQEK